MAGHKLWALTMNFYKHPGETGANHTQIITSIAGSKSKNALNCLSSILDPYFCFLLVVLIFFFTLNKILTWEINQEAWVLELSRRLTFVWVVAIENLINTCEANKYKNIHFSLNSLPSLFLTITAISSHKLYFEASVWKLCTPILPFYVYSISPWKFIGQTFSPGWLYITVVLRQICSSTRNMKVICPIFIHHKFNFLSTFNIFSFRCSEVVLKHTYLGHLKPRVKTMILIPEFS